MKTFKSLAVVAVAFFVMGSSAYCSSLNRTQILKELTDLELCIRTMCIPSNNAAMSIGGCQSLVTKLNQTPNTLDRWTIQRVNGVVLLLQQMKLKDGLVQMQATIKELPAR